MNKLVRPLAALIVAVLVVLASIAVAEVGLRVLPVQKPAYRDTSMPLPRLSPWTEPDFRTRSYQAEKQPGVFRIVVLGDSYTWGHGLHPEDAYPDRLERRLADLVSEHEFEVINWSHPGWSTEDAWRSIRAQIDAWDPDLLIVGFVLNDTQVERLTADEIEALKARQPSDGLGGWLYRTSRVVRGFYDAVENRRVRERLVAYYHELFENPEGWKKCQRALREIRQRARQLDLPLLLVVFPIFDSQIDDDYRYYELHELVKGLAGRLKIRHLDLLAAYQGVDANRLALVPFTDAHPSELAQRIAADAILDELLRRKWIKAWKPRPRPLVPRQPQEVPETG